MKEALDTLTIILAIAYLIVPRLLIVTALVMTFHWWTLVLLAVYLIVHRIFEVDVKP